MSTEQIEQERLKFPPVPAFSAKAYIKSAEQYQQMYDESL